MAKKLLEQMPLNSAQPPVWDYSCRTEEAYLDWAKRYILFHLKRHSKDMGGKEIFALDPRPRSGSKHRPPPSIDLNSILHSAQFTLYYPATGKFA